MTRLTIFLFFFTLSTMAQQVQDTLGKVKTPEEGVETKIAFENSCHYVVHNPLLIIDGKRYKTKKSYKKIKIDIKEIEYVVAFNPPESKKRFGRYAKYGAIYVISKKELQKAIEIFGKKDKRGLKIRKRRYKEIWEVYQFNLAKLSKLSDPSNQFDPAGEHNSSEKTKN